MLSPHQGIVEVAPRGREYENVASPCEPSFSGNFDGPRVGAAFIMLSQDGKCFDAGLERKSLDGDRGADCPYWAAIELARRERGFDALSDRQRTYDRVVWIEFDRRALRSSQHAPGHLSPLVVEPRAMHAAGLVCANITQEGDHRGQTSVVERKSRMEANCLSKLRIEFEPPRCQVLLGERVLANLQPRSKFEAPLLFWLAAGRRRRQQVPR